MCCNFKVSGNLDILTLRKYKLENKIEHIYVLPSISIQNISCLKANSTHFWQIINCI